MDGKLLEARPFSAGPRLLSPRGVAVGTDGVPVVLLISQKEVVLRRAPANGMAEDLSVAYIRPAVWIRPVALPEGRILLNDSEGMGVQIVDLNARRTWRRAFDSSKGDIFRAIGFIGADRRSGRLYVPFSGGLVAGQIP
jgi:hypothetical protein